MQGSITFNELGIFIAFLLVLVAGGYAIMTLRNINGLVKEATVLLQKNRLTKKILKNRLNKNNR